MKARRILHEKTQRFLWGRWGTEEGCILIRNRDGRGCMRCLDTHVGCYATAHTCFMLRNCMRPYCSHHARMGWGVGWAWLHALYWHTCWMLRNCTYMFHATQLYVLVLFVSRTDWGGGRGCMRCFGTHVGCYATAHTCFMLRNCMCPYCSHHARMGRGVGWAWLHALFWHTCWMLRNCTYMFHATQLYVLVLFVSRTDWGGWAWLHALSWHTCWMLRSCTYMFPSMHADHSDLFSLCGTQVAKMWHKRNQRVKFQRRCRNKHKFN